MKVQLVGGVLDGDSFELVPVGSTLPPYRLSYPWIDTFESGREEHSWLVYQVNELVNWDLPETHFHYVGKEPMK